MNVISISTLFSGDEGDQEKEYTKLVSLLPAEVVVGNGDVAVSQIACGQHHTGNTV